MPVLNRPFARVTAVLLSVIAIVGMSCSSNPQTGKIGGSVSVVASWIFTPVKNGLQNFVDHRFKPTGATPHIDVQHEIQTVEQRLAKLEERLLKLEGADTPDRDSA